MTTRKRRRRATVVSSTMSRQQQQQQCINNDDVSGAAINPATASTCVIYRSGSAADTQYLASIVQTDLVSRRLLHDVRGTLTHAALLLRALLLKTTTAAATVNGFVTIYWRAGL
jgi:hypothetical protein